VIRGGPALASDHGRIVETARARPTAKIEYSTVGLLFMPDSFTPSDLQGLYETVSGRPARPRRRLWRRFPVPAYGWSPSGGRGGEKNQRLNKTGSTSCPQAERVFLFVARYTV
jgi:hypothetical protein